MKTTALFHITILFCTENPFQKRGRSFQEFISPIIPIPDLSNYAFSGRGGSTTGTVWWDDFCLEEFNPYLPPFGPTPDNDSKSIDFGSDEEGIDGIVFNVEAMTDKQIEGDITFREIKPREKLILEIPAFNVDENGFPLTEMLLEIAFKDTYDERQYQYYSGNTRTLHRVFVYSGIQHTRCSKISYLGGRNHSKWTYMQYALSLLPH
jgi:hypothetical protein